MYFHVHREDWSSYSSPLFIVFYQASCLIFSKGFRLLAIWNYILANNWTTLGVVVCADEFVLIQVLVCNLLHVAGKPCTVYDAIFHPDTYKKGQEVWLSSLRYQTIFLCQCFSDLRLPDHRWRWQTSHAILQ